jgi:glycosyltransferase involved in cell wall biosynthesis
MKWWIFEDALRDRKGHWVEYLGTFRRGLQREGDTLQIFASRECERGVLESLEADPALPRSIWARMGDPAPRWKKMLRIITHALATWSAVSRVLRKNVDKPDLIFVPTVLVHHLLGWILLIAWNLRRGDTRVLLFFPNTPAFMSSEGRPCWNPDPSAKLFAFLIRRCSKWVAQGKLVLGAETEPMVSAMTQLTGVPFQYFPHPVEPFRLVHSGTKDDEGLIRFGAYGSARYEKGSDLIQEAIRCYLADQPDPRIRFSLQWIEDFTLPNGGTVSLNPALAEHPQCAIINDYFPEGGYEKQIVHTDIMILPYRDAYRLRVSRVVIEAMQASVPIIVACGTTLHQQAVQHGTPIVCQQDNPQSVLQAMQHAIQNMQHLKADAEKSAASSQAHFSVKTFRQLICQYLHE